MLNIISKETWYEMLEAEEKSGRDYLTPELAVEDEDGLLYRIWKDERTGKEYAVREIRTVHMGFNSNEEGKVDEFIAIVEREGECLASWGVTGRTMHGILAQQLAKELPQYEFEIGYNYHCLARKK